MTALYNEIDEAAAHILRHMIGAGVIAPGEVVTTSIKDLTTNDLKGFMQVHLFAGGGFWSVAARLAGWPDHEPLWTASCPCQPFSAAGQGGGTDDPRHLWPDVYRLARALRPPVIMGEQVAGKAGYGWFDGVSADLEREGYASRSVDFPACGVDAPHQRNRQYWIALANGAGEGRLSCSHAGVHREAQGQRPRHGEPERLPGDELSLHADTDSRGRTGRAEGAERGEIGRAAAERDLLRNGTYWSDAEWIICHDEKARRAKPGIRFLVDGLPGRVDLWRAGGNAIVPEAAKEVIAAFIDVYGLPSSWRVAA